MLGVIPTRGAKVAVEKQMSKASVYECMRVHSKFLLLFIATKQYTQTVEGQNFEDGVYIIVTTVLYCPGIHAGENE